MTKFFLDNSSLEEADVILLGVPFEEGTESKRGEGVANAPDKIREVGQKVEVYQWEGREKRNTQAQTGIITKKLHDKGNVEKNKVEDAIRELVKQKKMFFTLGGDHSITTPIFRGLEAHEEVALLYFDSHPDYVCSTDYEYHGSTVCDISKTKHFSKEHSAFVGIRAPEEEELHNLKNKGFLMLTPFDIQEKGIVKIASLLRKRLGNKKVYISIDMDVLDPAFVPAVSTPVPGGLSSAELIYLLKKLASLNIVGMDIVEINPKYDVQNRTCHLASRIIAEMMQSMN